MFATLDPVMLMGFTAAFAAAAILTARRPGYGASALVFVIPFALYGHVWHTTLTLPKVVLVGVMVGLIEHRSSLASIFREQRAVLAAFAAIVAAIALTAIPAMYRGEVIREALKWVEYALVFATVYAAYRLDPASRLLRAAFAASIVLVCCGALIQEAIGSPWKISFGHGIAPRISGALEGPNQLGAYLESALAFAAAWYVERARPHLAALLVLIGVTLMLTFSRGAIGACAAIVMTMVLVHRHALSRLAPFYLGALAGAAGDAAWIHAAQTLPALRNVSYGHDTAGGVGHRAELWRAAWFFFRRHPVLGIGAGNYERELARAGVYGVRTHASNWYLQALAEGGVVLFAATIAFLTTVIVQLQSRLRSWWALAAFAATIALALHQLVDYVVFYPKVAEPWIALIALGIADRPPSEP